jgi:hypothetical protein
MGEITKSFTIRDIHPEIHRAFKIQCIAKGTSMNDVLIEFMESYGKSKMFTFMPEDYNKD